MSIEKPTISEMIAVMTAFENGEIIEFFNNVYPSDNGWQEIQEPSWNWQERIYRIKPKNLIPDQINWDHVHSDYKFMARDEDSSVWLFKNKPTIEPYNELWVSEEDYDGAATHSSYIRGTVDYKDSLIERPKPYNSIDHTIKTLYND